MTEQSKIPLPGKGKSLFERAEGAFGLGGLEAAPDPAHLAEPANRRPAKAAQVQPETPAPPVEPVVVERQAVRAPAPAVPAERVVFTAHELHHHARQCDDSRHRSQHGEIAEGLPQRVLQFGNRSGGENLPHARAAVAFQRVLHDVEADQRHKCAGQHRHGTADPCRVVDPTVAVHRHRHVLASIGRKKCITAIDAKHERHEKTVTAHALVEIGTGKMIETVRELHAAFVFPSSAVGAVTNMR